MITNLKKQEYLKRLMDLGIPEVYQTFPKDFHVDVNGWSFVDYEETKYIDVQLTDSEVAELKEHGLLDKICQISGNVYKVKRLRTLDIELASDEAIDAMNTLKKRFEQGEFRGQNDVIDMDALKREFAGMYRTTCTQRCPHCFNQEDDFYVRKILDGHKLLKWSDMKQILSEAKKIGLESVKFLGIGEIFKIPDLFNILDDLKQMDIKIGIFTKGTALGDDKIAKDCGYEGVETAEELVRRLSEYDNVSILLGGNSFVPEIQDRMVGCGKDGGVTSYTEKRDHALKLLVKYGFNDPAKGKRLALVAAPVTPEVSDETVVMYEWAMHRNITVITIPTMVSGKGTDELEWLLGQFETNKELISRYDENNAMTREERYVRWLSDFYSDIYMSAVSMRITDLETLKAEGISGYAGAAKCQQMHNGMYIRLPGTVQECPGRCVGAEIADDIRDKSLLATWIGSKNYDRKDDCRALCAVKMKNLTGTDVKVCDCCTVYDNVGSMPLELERDTLIALEQKISRGAKKMYELIKVGEQSYYIESPARIGVYVENETEAYLIDSGNDKDAGRKIRQILETNGWTLKAIINTHSNADHIGGNQYLQKQTGCKVFSRGIEAAFTQYPVLEPAFLFGGYPLKELQHKFLMAKPSEVTEISAADFPQSLSVIDLPGHFFDMIGIKTPDGVAFIADCLNSKETLDKYKFTFIYDVEAYLHTLEQVGKMQAKMFVPAHAKPTEDIQQLVQYNISKVYENGEFLIALCEKPMNFEKILQQVFAQYNLVMNYEQYALLGSTIKSYLSWLKNSGKLVTEFSDNMLLWKKA